MGVRLENYLFRSDAGTYKEVNEIISSGRVKVNGVVQDDNNYKVDAASDFVDIDNKLLSYRKHAYIMINKPEGYVCAQKDKQYKTVMEKLPDWCMRRDMKPCNIIDRDMSGIVIVSDDISLQHSISTRIRRNDLVYHVQTSKPITIDHVEAFASGMKLKYFTGEISILSKADSYFKGEHATRFTAKQTRLSDINTMFKAMGVGVLSVELIALGDLIMPYELYEGDWRELNSEELKILNVGNPYL